MTLQPFALLHHLQGGWRSNVGEEHYWAHEHLATSPRRLRKRIPFTIPLILQAFLYMDTHIELPQEQRLLRALFANTTPHSLILHFQFHTQQMI
jgi:hypothetical protein